MFNSSIKVENSKTLHSVPSIPENQFDKKEEFEAASDADDNNTISATSEVEKNGFTYDMDGDSLW